MRSETFSAEGQAGLFNQIDLDLERTKRVYKVLGDLSQGSMEHLKAGDLKGFSFSSDKMRPMLLHLR